MDASDIITIIDRSGTIGLLVIIIVGGMRGWYVWNREHEATVKDRDFWRDVAMSGINAAERSLGIPPSNTGGRR